MLYTDGLKTQKGTGAGVFGLSTKHSEAMVKLSNASVFEAEVHAILSDSQAAIHPSIEFSCHQVRDDLGMSAKTELARVTLLWVSAHVCVEGNEKVDEFARKGAATVFVGPEHFCGLGDAFLKKELKQVMVTKRNILWLDTEGLRMF